MLLNADDFDSFIAAGSSNSVPGCFPASMALGIEIGSFSLDFQALALRRIHLRSPQRIAEKYLTGFKCESWKHGTRTPCYQLSRSCRVCSPTGSVTKERRKLDGN